ncbi:YciI family protein [Nocardioides bruguierae]|uniref:YciI family protein n=1 Tax=Nocardioides bruguierae TaxID=2945102 RepID=A0A9X2DC35_9ACTN|nr:YciI family protein [Nocardioides bruguierae]MCL8025761.1 YciI family protein [Nocardioides bruguierae]MCM0622637.1 YciI family protein [Nocardioides bruguierae]
MKFVVLIHSNPQPWGHPTSDLTAEYQALPAEKKAALGAHWDKVFGEADAAGEIVYGCALGDPSTSVVLGYDEGPVASDGPYAESKEHLAGFFVIDVETQARAREIAEAFACPGDTIELRPTMRPGCEA